MPTIEHPLLVRFSALCSLDMVVRFFLAYVAIVYGIALVRYGDFIWSSILVGAFDTALSVFLEAARNPFPQQQATAWFIGVGFLAVDLVLVFYYFRRLRTTLPSLAGLSAAGVAAFLFGLGCLSCGAVLGALIVSVAGTGALPFLSAWGGPLLIWAGILLLMILTIFLAKKATDPLVC